MAASAPGGSVMLSEDTYKKLPLERLWDKYLVLHVGEHLLHRVVVADNANDGDYKGGACG